MTGGCTRKILPHFFFFFLLVVIWVNWPLRHDTYAGRCVAVVNVAAKTRRAGVDMTVSFFRVCFMGFFFSSSQFSKVEKLTFNRRLQSLCKSNKKKNPTTTTRTTTTKTRENIVMNSEIQSWCSPIQQLRHMNQLHNVCRDKTSVM